MLIIHNSNATIHTNFIDIFPKLLDLAEEAHQHNTYAVGAVLIDESDSTVLRYARNSVIQNNKIYNYHNHAEKQLVDWYLENAESLNISNHKLTIISSLDPCIMCASTILASGLNAISISLDARAGINHLGDASYPFLNADLKKHAQESLGYFAIEGTDRGHIGYKGDNFDKIIITKDLHDKVSDYFLNSTFIVDRIKDQDNLDEEPCTQEQIQEYKLGSSKFSGDIGYTLKTHDGKFAVVDNMLKLAMSDPRYDGLSNVAAIIGVDKDILLFGVEDQSSPIKTAISNVTHKYWEMKVALEEKYNCAVDTLESVSLLSLYDLSHDSYSSFMDLAISRPIAKHEKAETSFPSFTYLINQDNADPFFHLLEHLPSRYQCMVQEGAQHLFPDQELIHYANMLITQLSNEGKTNHILPTEYIKDATEEDLLLETNHEIAHNHDEL